MWEAIGNGVAKGAGAAGWIIGLLCILGIFLGICTLFCLALSAVFGGEDEDEESDDTDDE